MASFSYCFTLHESMQCSVHGVHVLPRWLASARQTCFHLQSIKSNECGSVAIAYSDALPATSR